jgi:hypothetical protein
MIVKRTKGPPRWRAGAREHEALRAAERPHGNNGERMDEASDCENRWAPWSEKNAMLPPNGNIASDQAGGVVLPTKVRKERNVATQREYRQRSSRRRRSANKRPPLWSLPYRPSYRRTVDHGTGINGTCPTVPSTSSLRAWSWKLLYPSRTASGGPNSLITP